MFGIFFYAFHYHDECALFYIYLVLVSSIIWSVKVALFKTFAEKNKTSRFHLENLHLIPVAVYEDEGISTENVSVHDVHNKAGE